MVPFNDFTETLNEDQIEYGRLLFSQSCVFVLGAEKLEHIPATELPEIAFAGRSNVGKSSIINALTGHNNLARTSNTPGRTQEVNFFNLGNRLMIADLPGYGYARASKSRINIWTGLVNDYLRGRAQLRRACLLIDARHGLKDNDRQIMEMLDTAAVSYQIILTKIDKLSSHGLDNLIATLSTEGATHTALYPKVIPTSSRKGRGITNLRAELALLT